MRGVLLTPLPPLRSVFVADASNGDWPIMGDVGGWKFEPLTESPDPIIEAARNLTENPTMPSTPERPVSAWSEFRDRCAANVQRIRDTNDDGVYAKLYADDVMSLLMMVGSLDRQRDIYTTEAEHIWNREP